MRFKLPACVRLAAALCAVAALTVFSAAPALADGNGAQTQTFHIKNATVDFGPSANPCSGATGDLMGTDINGIMHETVNKAGDDWGTSTLTGQFLFTPDDPTQPTYTGHGTQWGGGSDNNQNSVGHFTFSLHMTGSDGSSITFHETGHMSTNANGDPTVVFDKQSVTCG